MADNDNPTPPEGEQTGPNPTDKGAEDIVSEALEKAAESAVGEDAAAGEKEDAAAGEKEDAAAGEECVAEPAADSEL